MTEDRNYVNVTETLLEKLVKSHQMDLFLVVFSYLKPLWIMGFIEFFVKLVHILINNIIVGS